MKLFAALLTLAASSLAAQERSLQVTTSTLEWKPVPLEAIPKGLQQKTLHAEADGSSSSAIIRFPKGYREPRHFHKTCSHTIYVLKGRLQSPKGELKAGTFLYSAANERHGPLTALEETEILFHTNGNFDYHVEEVSK